MIYRTTAMEETVRTLAGSHRLICVRTHHRAKGKQIRFRANSIADLPVHFYRPAVDGDGAILRWQEQGGILIDPTPRCDDLPAHDVHLFSECPVSLTLMQAQAARASMTVVYQPPTWDAQLAAVERLFPSRETGERVFKALHKLAKVQMTARYEAILNFTKFLRWTTPVCTDAELAEYSEVPLLNVRYVRDLVVRYPVMRKGPQCIVGLTPRFPPDDPAMRLVWERIKEMPDHFKGERFFRESAVPKLGRAIKRVLSTLRRTGSLTVNAPVYVYPMRSADPDWWAINRSHENAVNNFKEIRAMVKKAKVI